MARFVVDTSEIEAAIDRLMRRLPAPYQDANNLIALLVELFERGGCDFTIGAAFTAPETGDQVFRLGLTGNIEVEALALVASNGDVLRPELNRELGLGHDATTRSLKADGKTSPPDDAAC